MSSIKTSKVRLYVTLDAAFIPNKRNFCSAFAESKEHDERECAARGDDRACELTNALRLIFWARIFFLERIKVMRDSNFAGTQLSVVLVHPSRLFTEGLASLLKDTHYNIIHQLAGFESAYFSGYPLEGKMVFVVGGRSPSEIVEIIKNIRSQLPSAYILVINASTGPSDVMVALEAGADGYLRDAISSQTLVRVIELIIEDESILPPEFVKSLRESSGLSARRNCQRRSRYWRHKRKHSG